MPTTDDLLLSLLKACESQAPKPLYPKQYAEEQKRERGEIDAGLDELRRRGLVILTEWMRDFGQGVMLTELGQAALKDGIVPKPGVTPTAPRNEQPDIYDHDYDEHSRIDAIRQAFLAPNRAPAMRVLFALILIYFFAGTVYAIVQGLSAEDYMLRTSESRNQVLRDLGALHPYFILEKGGPARPEFERIVLFNFLHVGLIHLALNLYFLASLGRLIEVLWGSWRFLAIYAVAGIVSGCTVLLIPITQGADLSQIGLTAGASGCLFGIFASMIVWFTLNYQYLPANLIEAWSRSLKINALMLIAINFLPSVSWQGHLGGAIGGFLAAFLLHVHRHHPVRSMRLLALIAVPIVPLAFFVAVLYASGWL